MNRDDVRPEINLCGLMVVRRAHGPGWIAGEPYPRMRKGKPGTELRRPSYSPSPDGLLPYAVGRAEHLAGMVGASPDVATLLATLAQPYEGRTVGAPTLLGSPGTFVRKAREDAGLSKRRLAQLAGVSRTTIKDIEAHRTDPKVDTVARIMLAIETAGGPSTKGG